VVVTAALWKYQSPPRNRCIKAADEAWRHASKVWWPYRAAVIIYYVCGSYIFLVPKSLVEVVLRQSGRSL